jgi:hypothetical protein
MKRLFGLALAGLLFLSIFSAPAVAGRNIIKVMTRNQYLGADLTPVILAETYDDFVAAANVAFAQIAANDFRLRARRLAIEVALTRPHLIALQEVFDFTVNGSNLEPPSPFIDHLTETLNALAAKGQSYDVAATVVNLNLLDIPIPLDMDGDGFPDMVGLVSVVDRDVILAREDVEATSLPGLFADGGLCGEGPDPIPNPAFPILGPPNLVSTPSEDGCNYTVVAGVTTSPLGPITINRGFVGVNVTVGGKDYRVVNTHLEVRELPPGNTFSRIFQYVQSVELIETLLATTPANRKLILLGDFNSCDEDMSVDLGFIEIFPPYQIIVEAGFADIWDRNPLKLFDRDGFTCCQEPDLSNTPSLLDERIDIIFVRNTSFRPLAFVTGRVPIFPLSHPPNWASDHGGVFGKLIFR